MLLPNLSIYKKKYLLLMVYYKSHNNKVKLPHEFMVNSVYSFSKSEVTLMQPIDPISKTNP